MAQKVENIMKIEVFRKRMGCFQEASGVSLECHRGFRESQEHVLEVHAMIDFRHFLDFVLGRIFEKVISGEL